MQLSVSLQNLMQNCVPAPLHGKPHHLVQPETVVSVSPFEKNFERIRNRLVPRHTPQEAAERAISFCTQERLEDMYA